MNRALLLDLDDTLLRNSTEQFVSNYFRALSTAVAPYMATKPFLSALRYATGQMISNTNPTYTNEAIFWEAFELKLMVDRSTLEIVLNRFYNETYPTIAHITAPMAGSQALIDAAKAAGWKVVIATNPLYPLFAIQQRIKWAELDESQIDLITSYENMTSTKPHSSYFAQIAQMLGLETENCVMAGNHLSNDVVGAAAVGMNTFWVTTYPIADADIVPNGQGSLHDLHAWLFGN